MAVTDYGSFQWGSSWSGGGSGGGGGGGGVTSLNSLTGDLELVGAGGIDIDDSGPNQIIISSPSTGIEFFKILEDFSTGGYLGSGQIISDHFWSSIQLGSPSFTTNGSVIPSESNHPGVLEVTVSSAGTDGGGITSGIFGAAGNNSFITGGGEMVIETLIKIPTLSNGTNNASVAFGLVDSPGWSAPGNGIYITYQSVTSLNWYFTSVKASSVTQVISSIPVTAGWHNLKFVVNAAGTSIEFFIDGVSAGTPITTDIPVVALPPMLTIRKTLGASAFYMGVDYISLSKSFTTPR